MPFRAAGKAKAVAELGNTLNQASAHYVHRAGLPVVRALQKADPNKPVRHRRPIYLQQTNNYGNNPMRKLAPQTKFSSYIMDQVGFGAFEL